MLLRASAPIIPLHAGLWQMRMKLLFSGAAVKQ